MKDYENREPTVERIRAVSSIQEDYSEFKNKTAIKRIFDPVSELYWTYYENITLKKSSNSDKTDPTIVLLHGICGTAGCYFYLFNKLTELGYRCISAQYPEYLTPYEWIAGFLHFIEYLNLSKPCVFGSDLGGFLLQLFVQRYPDSLNSIILCNSYRRTDAFSVSPEFRDIYGNIYSILPHIILKGLYIEYYICPKNDDYNQNKIELREQYAKEFMAYELDQLSSNDLGSRITLQLTGEYVYDKDLSGFKKDKILLIETNNNNIPEELTQDIKAWYKNSKVGYIKNGGDFPYLTRPEEIAVYIQVHLNNIKYSQENNYNKLLSSDSFNDSHSKTKIGNISRDEKVEIDYDSENSVINL
ncbi:hypothetical protein MACK_002543 [Theileria orientalis]|uniref:Maspardin n=1 Tax=Theileria orientalis TaxID=68886 RepID=A0A976MDN3_THEOR|nr:hypothetical protein MACK_002543 [Theileria orientalis]